MSSDSSDFKALEEALRTIDQCFDYGSYLQVGAIIVSIIVATVIVKTHRSIARKRAILDFIVHEQTDQDMIKARKTFVKLKKTGNLVQYATENNVAKDQTTTIRAILNIYELAAIGIKKGAYDEEIYKDWCRTTAVRDWIAVKEFVKAAQGNFNSEIYVEFQALAIKWADEKERKSC